MFLPAPALARFLEGRSPIFFVDSGSALYGTALDSSDTDFRGVFLPLEVEILTGNSNFGLDSNVESRKLGKGDLDISATSLIRYLGLLGRMDTISLEILFASRVEAFRHGPFHPVTDMIWEERDALIAGSAASAIGHARQRLGHLLPETDRSFETYKAVHEMISKSPAERLCDDPELLYRLDGLDHVRVYMRAERGDMLETPWAALAPEIRASGKAPGSTIFLQVLNKRLQIRMARSEVLKTLEGPLRKIDADRRAARHGPAITWKDAYHAIRILTQAREFYETRSLTFPRPEAKMLLEIRAGNRSADEIGELASALLADLQDLEITRPFRPEACSETRNDLICAAHRMALAA